MTNSLPTRAVGPRPLTPRTLIVMVFLAAALWYLRSQQPPAVPQPEAPAHVPPIAAPAEKQSPAERPSPSVHASGKQAPHQERRKSDEESSSRSKISNVTIRDQDGDVVFRGDVDLAPTLERIDSGERLRFPNDGSTFQNREGRLPRQPAGYYREWVHPTPKLSGPGPQRIVTGREGEAYYTPDHYRTFQRIR